MYFLSCLLFVSSIWLCQATRPQHLSGNVRIQNKNWTDVAQLSSLMAQSSEIQDAIIEKEEKTSADMHKQGEAKMAKLGLLGLHGGHSLLPLLLLSGGHHGKLSPLLLLLLSGKLGVGHNPLVQLLLLQHLGIGKGFHGLSGIHGLSLLGGLGLGGKLGLLGGLGGLGLGGINPLLLLLLANDLKKSDDKYDPDVKHGRVFPDFAELPPIKYPAYFDPMPPAVKTNHNYALTLDQYPVETNLPKDLINVSPYDWMSATQLNEAAPPPPPPPSPPASHHTAAQSTTKSQQPSTVKKQTMINKLYVPATKQDVATYTWTS